MDQFDPKTAQPHDSHKSDDRAPRPAWVRPDLIRHGTVGEITAGGPIANNQDVLNRSITVSDAGVKENRTDLDTGAILESVAGLDIQGWSYRWDSPAVRHIGPMAQDFAAAFGVGDSDRVIHHVDVDGVALASIQALRLQLRAAEARIDELAARVRELGSDTN